MIGSAIIERFHLQIDDSSELSSTEELDLALQIYNEIADDREWEWLKKTATGTTSVSVPYIALPADFKNLVPNKDGKSVVFVGTDYQEYQVVPFSSRRDFRDMDGVCWIDIPNSRLYFALQPSTTESVEYDYIHRPADFTLTTAPLVTTNSFGEMIAYGMAGKFNPIELSEKNSSYQAENIAEFRRMMADLATEDAMIKLSI
jgi:hypothetical protein